MEVEEAIRTRVEVREYASDPVDGSVKRDVLEAGRLAPSGRNLQHWRFVLVDDPDDVDRLAELSTTGEWVAGADFAVVVLTDPGYEFNELDAGRAITHMQFAAWDAGVGSCIYTGYDEDGMREFLDVPDRYDVTAVVGFGRPRREIRGRKRREPLSGVAFRGRFGEDPGDLVD
jgi:nitroreductase